MNSLDLQVTLFIKGAEVLPQKINHLNNLLFKIKTALLTLWSASMGWAITTKSAAISTIGLCLIAGFLFPDIAISRSQDFYINRLVEIHFYLRKLSNAQLNLSETKGIPGNLIFPLTASIAADHERSIKKINPIRNLKSYFIVPYATLIISNILIFVYLLQI
ncbi:MAG: hypothetical protein AAGA18_13940 [Verrucomicrobiota bacterium]